MVDPRTNSVELRYAIIDGELISKARRDYAAEQLAAAGNVAVVATEAAEIPAPVVEL